MMLRLLLKHYGHEPYYDIPDLKDPLLRQTVHEIFERLKKDVQETMGIFP